MDAIGLMVTAIEGEFLRVAEVGGIDARVLPGQLVTVHGREDLPAVVAQPPARLLPAETREGPVTMKYLLVDTGLPERQVRRLVRIGDLVSFAQPPVELGGETLSGHSLDNRASVAALTQALEELKGRTHAWDVWAVATVQEETSLGGAQTSAFQLRPGIAVAVDVTWARGPGAPDYKSFPLGKGPALGWGPNIHPGLHQAFKDLATRLEIPFNVEVMPRHSGTDAISMQITAEGIPTMVVSIPLRYMHTPVEMISLKDISRTGRLLAEFIASLEPDYLEKLSLDD
jgi:endoglucanase